MYISNLIQRGVAFLLMIWLSGHALMAQCSQCKAAASSSDGEGNLFFGKDLNTGVLYLLALPLILPFIIGGIWYYKARMRRKQMELEASLGAAKIDQYLD